jgi:lipoate-protein ligase B
VEERAREQVPNTVLFVEHPWVITLGRKSPGVLDPAVAFPPAIGGVPVHIVERGGEATLHGPGQIVAYPILRLNGVFGPKALLRALENAIIAALKDFGLESYWIEGKTGVWLKDKSGAERKIASLGVAVRKSVSYHGLALNVSTELGKFRLINPCGFAPAVMTNMEEILGGKVELPRVQLALQKHLEEIAILLEQSENKLAANA